MDMAVGTAPALVVSDLHKSFGSLEVLKGVSLTASNGDVIAMIGSSGSGKSTLLALHQPARDPGCRRGLRRRRADPHDPHAPRRQARGPQAGRPHPHQARHGVPELQSVVAHDRARERDRGAGPRAEEAEGGGDRARRGAARQGRDRGQAQPLSRAPVGRPAAARGDRAGARHGAGADAVRRADLGARPGAGRRGAARDARSRARKAARC